jgi:hypothetical protein
MLVMFAAGFANLWSMVVLTGSMTYEVTGRHGQRSAAPRRRCPESGSTDRAVGPVSAGFVTLEVPP